MSTFRVRYSVWNIEGSSAEDAKKNIVDLMKKSADKLITVEDASIYNSRRSLWKRLLFG
jgi:hypothetical protein